MKADLPIMLEPATPALGEVMIELRRAEVHFGARRALQGIDLRLQRGDRLALVGANGSGKTTLLRLLQGQLPCAAGERLMLPDSNGRMPSMAMLFQKPFLLRLSVWRNLALALWLRGVPAAERGDRVHAALRRVGLLEMARRPARDLSGGQQQRLALARAWALQPDILLLDEPTASLDPSAKREVEELLAEFAADGVSLVMSTHNLGQAKRLARRVVYLESGRLVVDCPVDDFFNAPLPPEAALFLKGELSWT